MADGSVIQAEAALIHAAHDVSHHFMDVARGLATLHAGAPEQRGTVRRVNASDGGVPKLSIGGADVPSTRRPTASTTAVLSRLFAFGQPK
jgi:hypothetical protein